MNFINRLPVALAAAALVFAGAAAAETRITYKSAASGSSYYQMGVQIAEAMKRGTDGAVIVTIEESQGSVQNVMEAAVRSGNYVFTTPPALVSLAQQGKAMFEGKGNPRFEEVRALFPIPSLTMHFVVRDDSGIENFADLEGKSILIGKGSFGATEGEKYLQLFGLEGKVNLADVELDNAVPALKNRQIDGFVTAGSYPAPNVIEAAAGTGIRCRHRPGHRYHVAAGRRLHHHRHGRRHRLPADEDLLGAARGHGRRRAVVERRDARPHGEHPGRNSSRRASLLRRGRHERSRRRLNQVRPVPYAPAAPSLPSKPNP